MVPPPALTGTFPEGEPMVTHLPIQRATERSNLIESMARGASIKKADAARHPKVFDHVGLLFNEPPGTAEMLFI